ncbi:MAG: hypothetical protein LBP62_00345 [Clostridiales bacterium]|jgi:hypothetical protein|nr:hypothetical protein [Clostridiales bacterium]
MNNITLKKENILAVMSFREDNIASAAVLKGFVAEKRAVFIGRNDIRSLIIFDGGGEIVCYAAENEIRSINARLQKGLYLNL